MPPRNRDDVPKGTLFHRQLGIFNPEKYDFNVHVIGVGATGSFDVLALSKLGFTAIHAWDYDTIETHNQPGQLYGLDDVNKPKVEALKELVQRMTNNEIVVHNERWDGQPLTGIVICAVDSMKVRTELFEACRMKPRVLLFIDHRIGGQNAQLFTVLPTEVTSVDRYVGTLFSDEDASRLPCTERSVIDINFFVASMVVRQIRSFLVIGEETVIPEIHYNAKTGDIVRIEKEERDPLLV